MLQIDIQKKQQEELKKVKQQLDNTKEKNNQNADCVLAMCDHFTNLANDLQSDQFDEFFQVKLKDNLENYLDAVNKIKKQIKQELISVDNDCPKERPSVYNLLYGITQTRPSMINNRPSALPYNRLSVLPGNSSPQITQEEIEKLINEKIKLIEEKNALQNRIDQLTHGQKNHRLSDNFLSDISEIEKKKSLGKKDIIELNDYLFFIQVQANSLGLLIQNSNQNKQIPTFQSAFR
eukprot:TRINITY_DN13627_c0_g1_i1.p2 TRINITY_DN13627_c0_g1~~TRINITY_DN13627_c0_g1_i1.p2  ORF type:complete len:235 (-),score=46.02 TRINITY_DN13627_c0_g1_i1:133-837(-)